MQTLSTNDCDYPDDYRYHHAVSAEARILDANTNRAQEAARVLEDLARFSLNDVLLSGSLKQLRHDLAAAVRRLPDGWLAANRDTPGDVGTRLNTDSETSRANLADVAVAAGRRLVEALRVMEEIGKLVDTTFSRDVKAIRYRAYELDAAIQARLSSGRARQWRVCLILTESICRKPWRQVLGAALEGGADCVQVREKSRDGGKLVDRVRDVLAFARPAGATVIVNDRADVALASGADGVHLGQSDLTVADVRRLAGRRLIIGVSTHSADEASAAVTAGADYCGIGSMFPSATQPGAVVSGPDYAREFTSRFANTPHLAIGGIDQLNVPALVDAGVRGIAVSRAICDAADPAQVARLLVSAMASRADARPDLASSVKSDG